MDKSKNKLAVKNCLVFSLFFCLMACFFAGCEAPSFSGTIGKTVSGGTVSENLPSTTIIPGADEEESSVIVQPIELTDNFMLGFDASYVDAYEELGRPAYKDRDGTVKDVFEILKTHGINTVRLRIWVDPDPQRLKSNGVVLGNDFPKEEGDNTLERTIRMAKRAKAAGLKIMLDFHYSDYWADPGKQIIPYTWRDATTVEEMASKISTYTTEVLNAMKTQSVLPDYVQVGNEIDSGILRHVSITRTDNGEKDITNPTGTLATLTGTGSGSASNFAKYLVAGCQAVRDVSPSSKIILHVTNKNGVTTIMNTMKNNKDLYDIIGLSYYPWENHGTIASLKTNIQKVRDEGKDVIVAETSMYYNYGNWDKNIWHLNRVYNQMVDPKTNQLYKDLVTASEAGDSSQTEPMLIVTGTLQNQVNVIRHIIEETADAGGIGVCAWGGDMLDNWQYSFFDGNGKAMDSIDVFNLKNE